jgi:molybdopterin molybdotransferase
MGTTSESAKVLTFEQARDTVLEYCSGIAPPPIEERVLFKVATGRLAVGRVLAEPVQADRDFPPFPRATRDGYAVRSVDVKSVPTTLRVLGQVKAGRSFERAVGAGEAVEIMTGAGVPEGADAVVMVEYTAPKNASRANEAFGQIEVEIKRAVGLGENIVAAGAEARAGQELLTRGVRLGPAEIAMAAAAGQARIRVYSRPIVTILSTGDELVEIDKVPGPSQIRNSNGYSLAAQVLAAGGRALPLALAPDRESELRLLIELGLGRGDLLLISGGVSAGKFDFVEPVLKSLGAKFFFTGAMIQPGRPVVFGEVEFPELNSRQRWLERHPRMAGLIQPLKVRTRVPFFGLPGNPISAMVCFDLFAQPVVEALGGAAPGRLRAARARLKRGFRTRTGLTRFLPANLQGGLYDPEVETIPWQGSGDLAAVVRANCYLVVPPDREVLSAGEMVSVVLR